MHPEKTPPENSLCFESPLYLGPEHLDGYEHLNNSQAGVLMDAERLRLFLGLIHVENLGEMAERYNLGIVISEAHIKYPGEVKPDQNPKIITKVWRPRPAEFLWHQTITANEIPAVIGTFQSFLVDPITMKLKPRPPEGIFPF